MNRVTRARSELVNVLNDAPDLRDAGLTAYAVIPDGGAGYPVAFVELDVERPRATKRRRLELEFMVFVVVSAADSQTAQEQMDGYLDGATSIRELLESDRKLNGVADDVIVGESRSRGLMQVGGVDGWAREWRVNVLMNERGE